MKKSVTIMAVAAMLTACGTSKQTVKAQPLDTTAETINTTAGTASDAATLSGSATAFTGKKALNFVRKVNDNAVYAKNINTKIDLTLTVGGKPFSVSGRLQMRQDEVIRITLTPFGLMEVGRLEFTPNYVLLVNRMDKQYVKAEYSKVSFLQANSIDFAMLQSIFWNRLFIPGESQLKDGDLDKFAVSFDNAENAESNVIELTSGKLNCQWQADKNTALIGKTTLTYDKGGAEEATVTMQYGSYTSLGVKQFPTAENIAFNAKQLNGKQLGLAINMNGISTDGNWDALTTVSDKYTEITPEEFFSKLSGF